MSLFPCVRLYVLLVLVVFAGTSCWNTDRFPEQTLDTILWERIRLPGYSIPLPAGAEPVSMFDDRRILCSERMSWSVERYRMSDIVVTRDRDRDVPGWNVCKEREADVYGHIRTYETSYSVRVYRLLILVLDGEPHIRIEVVTHLIDGLYDAKVKSRIREDQRIYEYIRDHLLVMKDGHLVKPVITTLSDTIKRPKRVAPRHLIQDLSLTGYKLPSDTEKQPDEVREGTSTEGPEKE